MKTRSLLYSLMIAASGIAAAFGFSDPTQAETNSVTDEIVVRNAIRAEGAEMVRRGDFAGITAAARRYRDHDLWTPSGTSRLSEFYAGIEVELGMDGGDAGCRYTAGAFIKDWQQAEPETPTPYIVEADLLSDNAWCLRGNGFAGEVSDKRFALFHRQIDAAENVLNRHRIVAAADPAFYSALLGIYNDSGKDESDYQKLLDEAVQRYPAYPDIYFGAARHYLPQWGGSYDAVDALARRAERELPAGGNSGGYARVYWYLIGCGCYNESMPIDRPLLRKSMSEALAKFPDDWNVSNFALVSCRAGDPFAAQAYFKALRADYDPSSLDQEWWQFCHEIAGVAPTQAAKNQPAG